MNIHSSRRLLPVAAALGFMACQGGLFTIDIEQSAQTTVPAGTLLEDLLGELGFEEFVTVDITASEELQNQGVQPGDIVNVTLTAVEMSVVAPSSGDLSFFDEITVFVEADTLPRVQIASLNSFPDGQQQVSFNLDEVDLTDYAVSQAMTIDTEVTGRSPDEETTIQADIVVEVGVTSQGACNQIRGTADSGS